MSDTETTTTEDRRVTEAREALAASRVAAFRPGYNPGHWWGRLETAVALLLDVIDERAVRGAVLEESARKPHDDLMRTVAEIRADRGERP